MNQEKIAYLQNLAKLVRYSCLFMTTEAGSGHLTSALSAADLATVLFFDKLRFDLYDTKNPENDRFILSKGHASPLLYALYRASGVLSDEDLKNYRQLSSPLEGHPTPAFPYVEIATGSLGQGLAAGLGMALSAKYLDKTQNKIYVLLGDGEAAEGSVWESIQIASYYKLGNLVGIIDVNRLGQSQETMLGRRLEAYAQRVKAFGWESIVIDGHNLEEIDKALDGIKNNPDQPKMIIAATVKGKGVPFLEDKNGWHGKVLTQEEFGKAKGELGEVDFKLVGLVKKPQKSSRAQIKSRKVRLEKIAYRPGDKIATRKAFGEALSELVKQNQNLIVLDADVKNSTFTELVDKNHFFELFIAEQDTVGVAAGLSTRGKIPVVSTFACFFTRALDQIRMNAISGLNIKYAGTHAGVSIGQDGPSQMGLEDLAVFRAVFKSTILYPSDGVSAAKLTQEMLNHQGIVYLRLARPDSPIIYDSDEEFPIGSSKILAKSKNDRVTVIAAGITVFEVLKAQKELTNEGINIRVIDCYSIKPIDGKTLKKAAQETCGKIITVEDHWFEGGLGDAVLNVFGESGGVRVYKMAVTKMPHSGKTDDNLRAAGIDSFSIVQKVKEVINHDK